MYGKIWVVLSSKYGVISIKRFYFELFEDFYLVMDVAQMERLRWTKKERSDK
jgi:hypothetical protein